MKNFRFLAIAILMLSVLILPVNADHYLGFNPTTNITLGVNPTDTVISFHYGYYNSNIGYFAPQSTLFAAVNDGSVSAPAYQPVGTLTDEQLLRLYLNPYQNGLNTFDVYHFETNNVPTLMFKVSYDITDNYTSPFNDAYLLKTVIDQTSSTITYDVQAAPDTYLYSPIGYSPINFQTECTLTSSETTRTFVLGDNGTNAYCLVYNANTGQKAQLQIYLEGLNDLPSPTVEPTAQPTSAPDDDLSQYGEKKNFQIRNIDYSANDMLLINGINLTIYYTDSNDNIISKPIYKSNSAPSVIDLRVPKAGGLFVEYGITPNYEPVKVQTYPVLNNRVGYWINQEISDYENLYYQYYDSDNPLTDINYGITLIDGNTHLPVSNAAINIDGSNTQYTSNYGGTVFKNITQGLHTFTISKQGYNTLTFTKNIVITSSTEIEFFPISAIPTATITPSPVKPITPSPTISPIDKPTSILESVSYGLAKVFGVKTVDNANYIFALLIILFPAAIAGGITHQALGFIAGGMLGFVFALTIGLVPIWTFFAMCLLAVIYIMLIRGNEGF